ncbi:MAG: hypothetical protein KJI71_00475 [Patescibacteria group bacterium]|nr:hypothetical protein [Patescibacteria group bacterium]
MTNEDLDTFLDFNIYSNHIKSNRKKNLLHSIAERNLQIILKDVCPEYHPVNESNVNGGRVDLIYYFDSIGHSIHFEIFTSYSTVIKDLRLLEQSEFDIRVAILIDDEIDPSISKKYFREKPINPFPFFNLNQIFMDNKIETFKREISNLIKTFKLSMKSEVVGSDLMPTRLVKSFRVFSPSKKDLLDLDDINYSIAKLNKGAVSPKAEERILKDISNNLSDIAYIETLKEDSKITLNNLLEFLLDYLQGKGETTLIGVLEILTWLCRSEMLNEAKSIYHNFIKTLFDENKRYYELLEILFWFGHFEDRVHWLSMAIDEKDLNFINILTGDLGSPNFREQKLKIRDMLYERLDIYELDSDSLEIVQKINFLLEGLRNI